MSSAAIVITALLGSKILNDILFRQKSKDVEDELLVSLRTNNREPDRGTVQEQAVDERLQRTYQRDYTNLRYWNDSGFINQTLNFTSVDLMFRY